MTVIQVRPHPRGGWQVSEGPGVAPYFIGASAKESALTYAQARMAARAGEIHVLNSEGEVTETISTGPQAQRI